MSEAVLHEDASQTSLPACESEATFPSFSLVIEPYNLRSSGQTLLRRCLDSIAGETPPPTAAREALLLDEGGTGSAATRELVSDYPWLTFHRVPQGLGYGDLKATGSEACTGEVVILLDSDCVYERGWLRHVLALFAADRECAVVTGETALQVTGPYSLAAAIFWVFPGYSGERAPAPARYYAHPTAIRRAALARCPLPRGLPLLRGQGVIHALALRAAGYRIWRHPQVRVRHPVPPPLNLVARFFAQGCDSRTMARLVNDRSNRSLRGFYVPVDRRVGRVRHLAARARMALADRRRLLMLPAALPIGAGLVLAYAAGRVAARIAPAAVDRLLGLRR